MLYIVRTAAFVVAATAGAASAQGFKGAEIDLDSVAYTEDTEVNQTTLRGSVEFGATDRLAFALDVGGAVIQPGDGEVGTATLHAIFDVSPTTSLGVFASSDESDGLTYEAYGAEAGFAFARSEFEVFAAVGNAENVVDITVVGVDGRTWLGDRFAFTTSFAYLDSDFDIQGSRTGIGGEARLGSASTLYMEVGQDNLEGETATYFGLGARFAFGSNGGTTFNPRGIVDVFGGI